MSTLLQGRIYSMREKTRYDVFVDDGPPSTGSIYQILIKDIDIVHDFAKKEVDASLFLSKCKVTFRVQTSAQEAVFAAMSGAEETRFRIRILKEGQLHYVGFVQMGLLTTQDSNGDYDLKVEATDAVARLKFIPYNGGGLYYDDYTTFQEHIRAILAAIPLSDYYAAGDEYYRINATMWPEGLAADDDVDQTALTRFSHRAMRTIDGQGAVKFSNMYDVLHEICKAQGWRFMYSQGRYVFTDTVDYARTVGAIKFLRYDINGDALSPEVLGGGTGTQWTAWTRNTGELSEYDSNAADSVTKAGGKIQYLPALHSVDWSYQHYSKQNALSTIAEWSNSSTDTIPIQNFRTAPGLQLRVSANAQIQVTPPNGEQYPSVPVHAIIGMKLFVEQEDGSGESVVRSAILAASSVSYSAPEWLGGIDGRYYAFASRVESPFFGNPVLNIQATTPTVPSSGTLKLRFYLVGVYKNGEVYAGASVDWRVFNPYVETAINGSVTSQYNFSNFTAENNGVAGNSEKIERKVLLGDGPNANTFGRIEYFDGVNWQLTHRWRKYAAGQYQDNAPLLHGALRARDILALQDRPRQRLTGTLLIRDYAPEYIYQRAGKRYLAFKAIHNLLRDEVTGEYIEIAYAPAQVTEPEEVPSDGDPNDGTIAPEGSGFTNSEGTVGNPSDVTPPGQLAPGLNTITTSLDGDIPEGDPTDQVPIQATPSDLPLFEGDHIVITNPTTGQTQTVVVAYNSEFGVPAPDQQNPGPDAVPFYTETGVVWLIPDDTNVAVEGFTPGFTLPADSFVQFDAEYLVRLRALLRIDHIDAHIVGFDTALTVELSEWFLRPGPREGWHIRKVHFAFGQAGTGRAKINLKYYDATGERYTIATHDQTGGLESTQEASAVILDGYLRAQVEVLEGTPPKGLSMVIEVIKILPNA